MSDSDSKSGKPRKPLTSREKWRNLCDALAEDALKDNDPLTESQQGHAEKVRERIRALKTAKPSGKGT